jgi:ParB/RepB/Spo0J family partition protein
MARNSTGKATKFDARAQASGAVDKLFGARAGEQVVSGLKLIRHEHIAVKPQPRTQFSNIEVAELAGSIAHLHERGEGIEGTGILQPLLVTLLKDADPDNADARYRLIAGERRFRASQEAGLPHVPCLVLSLSETGVLPAQLIENLQRQNLAPLDEARALEQLRDEQGLSVRDLAKQMGKTRGYVTNRLDLLKMGEDVQAMVSSREDTLRVAYHIERVADPTQRAELIRAVVEEGIGEREVLRRIEGDSGDTSASTPTGSSTPVSSREDTSTGFGSAGGSTRSIRETPPQPPDPISSALRPAAAFVAEAARQVEELRLTADYKRQLREAVQNIKEQLDKIEKAVK